MDWGEVSPAPGPKLGVVPSLVGGVERCGVEGGHHSTRWPHNPLAAAVACGVSLQVCALPRSPVGPAHGGGQAVGGPLARGRGPGWKQFSCGWGEEGGELA